MLRDSKDLWTTKGKCKGMVCAHCGEDHSHFCYFSTSFCDEECRDSVGYCDEPCNRPGPRLRRTNVKME